MASIADSSSLAFPSMSRARGGRRERVFFGDDAYALYRDPLASQCRKHGVAVFCHCLRPSLLRRDSARPDGTLSQVPLTLVGESDWRHGKIATEQAPMPHLNVKPLVVEPDPLARIRVRAAPNRSAAPAARGHVRDAAGR
jgi:hypothetical protein